MSQLKLNTLTLTIWKEQWVSPLAENFKVRFCISINKSDVSKQRWFSGRILACHAGGPGSIPGRCKCFILGLGEFSRKLNASNMKLVLIFDPTICTEPYVETEQEYPPLNTGLASDVFIKQDGEIVLGIAYAGLENASFIGNWTVGWQPKTCPSAFIDFFKKSTSDWWTKQLTDFYEEVQFSAIWIDKNEPKNYLNGAPDGCGKHPFENPPYIPSNLNCYAKNDLNILSKTSRSKTKKIDNVKNFILNSNNAWFNEIDDDELGDEDGLDEMDGASCRANEIQHETICMTAEMEVNGKKEWHYNAHGLYGNSMTQAGFQIIAF